MNSFVKKTCLKPRQYYVEDANSKKYSFLLGISSTGEYFGQLVGGGVTSTVYSAFLVDLAKFDSSKTIYIVQDNAPIHKSRLVLATSHIHGIKAINTPGYFPQGNAVELMFALIKHKLKKMHTAGKQALLVSLDYTLYTIPKASIMKMFKHAYEDIRRAAGYDK